MLRLGELDNQGHGPLGDGRTLAHWWSPAPAPRPSAPAPPAKTPPEERELLTIKQLVEYSTLSVRTLRAHLTDSIHPLPCYRVGTKILVRRSEFDGWMEKHRHVGVADVDRLMAEMFSQPERTR